jgi:DNA repair exonuclease SbcCD ATPase subunit
MIVKLILKNYTPLSKKGVTYVELNTKSIFNIILGRNGFGKTSLLRELTPWPADNADYMEGGYKEVHIVVGKNTFVLTSSTGKGSEHHFILNGKELNEGNTLLVQRDLVKMHFNFNLNTKNVITGLDVKDLFSTLSAVRRKDFLMSVNPNDTSYALKMYERLKSNHNALKGGLKTQRQRLVVEEGRLTQLATMDPVKLQEEIRILDDQVKNALIIHGQLQEVQSVDTREIKDEIGNIISFLLGTNVRVKFPKSQLLTMKEQQYGTLDFYKSKEIRYSSLLVEFANTLAGLDLANNNLDSYRHRLTNLDVLISDANDQWSVLSKLFNDNQDFPIDVNDESFEEFAARATEFTYLVQSVNRAVDSDITSTKFTQQQVTLQQVNSEYLTLKRTIDDIVHQLDHYNRAESADCPSCNTTFKPGLTQIKPEVLKNTLVDHNTRLVVLKAKVEELTDYIDDNQGWYDSMSELLRFSRNTEHVGTFVKIIQVYQIGKKDTSVLVKLLKGAVSYVDVNKTLAKLNEERENVEKQIKFLESSDVETLIKRSEYVERELSVAQRSIRRILNDIKDIDDQLDLIELDSQRRYRLNQLVSELQELLLNNGQYKIKLAVKEAINELTPRKDQMISGLIRAESLNSVIQSIKDNIADMERREKHTALLMDGLSPIKGLIGYLMNDFLKSVVANVNAIVQPIWTNRLQVLNCSVSKGEDDVDLNYNFPVVSGDSNKPNRDVGNCSGGEREILNFAFRLVLLRYLGTSCSIPLMMDEVGVAFDELHRGRFAAYISEQLRLDKLPQTFMISHYVNQYGAFNTANVIALNTEGLSVPGKVNTNSVLR